MKLSNSGTLWLYLLERPNYWDLIVLDINIRYDGEINHVDYTSMFAGRLDKWLYYEIS